MAESFSDLVWRASGSRPYPYQQHLADAGLPELLAVETGAGKTAAVFFAWLWRRRFYPDEAVRASTPHWLVLCEPMRTLTEQAERAITDWLEKLGLQDEVLVHVTMGGNEEGQRRWRLQPERDAVVIGTIDMLLSRALNRGYGASRFSWPLDFALLNNGTHWVFDEVQLLGPALPTGRQLQGLRSVLRTAIQTSSTWMSATVDGEALSTVDNPYLGGPDVEVRLGQEDRTDPELSVRLNATRQVRRVEVEGKKRPTALARTALDLHRAAVERHPAGPLTLVVVNQVATAQAVHAALQKLAPEMRVHLLHGRFRPADRDAVAKVALEKASAGSAGRIVVSTQVVEAGVDISAAVLLTEAAPWPSIVQRAGRCNRDGKADGAVLAWVAVAARDAPPYEPDDIEAAMAALDALEGVEVTATMLGEQAVKVSALSQPVLRRADLLSLFDTAPDVSGNDVDVGPFIRDGEERDVFVAWRDVGARPLDGTTLRVEELCKVPLTKDAVEFARREAWRFNHLSHRRGEWVKLGGTGDRPRPGELLLVPSAAGGYDPERGWTPKITSPVTPVPDRSGEVPSDPDDNPLQPIGDEASSQAAAWVALRRHLEDVEAAVRSLSVGLKLTGLTAAQLEAAAVAGRLHDIGKAHPVFQESLLDLVDEADRERMRDGAPWAKSGISGVLRHSRRAFRHELASALALLGDAGVALRGVEEPDLVVYLVASHHGRIRLGIRSVPDMDNEAYVLGIGDGDELPRIEVPEGETPLLRLSLDPVRMGRTPDGSPSWSERALRLLDELGPFRLAFLEALVRLADWRASVDEGVTGSQPVDGSVAAVDGAMVP